MKAHAVVVQFADGRSTDGRRLRRELSADIFQRQAHYDLAGAFARAASGSPEVEPVLHNLLAMKSSLLRDVSAALYVFEHDSKIVRELHVAPNVAKVLARLVPLVPVAEKAGMNAELISRRTALTTIAKAIAHRLYRVRRKPYISGKAVVRAWVDVTLKMYREEVRAAQVRVFPFPLSRRRQENFFDELDRQRIEWTRDGLPYRLASIAKLLVAGQHSRPYAVAKFEHDAFADFATEVAMSGAGPIYTSDEFEVGAVTAGRVFRGSGTEYVNSAHGVGLYCPRTAYSHFRFLTQSQQDFYAQASPDTHFSRRATANFVMGRKLPQVDDQVAVIFVHQDFKSAGLLAEACIEEQIIAHLDKLKLPAHVSKYVKVHPNSDPHILGSDLKDCTVAASWNGIEAGRCLFLIINSTAFYDLTGIGDFAVFKDFSFAPEIYLEGEYSYFNLQTLTRSIKGWVESQDVLRRNNES